MRADMHGASLAAMVGLLSGSPPPDGPEATQRLVVQACDIGEAMAAEMCKREEVAEREEIYGTRSGKLPEPDTRAADNTKPAAATPAGYTQPTKPAEPKPTGKAAH